MGGMDYLDKMATDVGELIRGEASGGPTGGMVDSLGFEFGRRNPFVLPLRPVGRGQEETGQRGRWGEKQRTPGPGGGSSRPILD